MENAPLPLSPSQRLLVLLTFLGVAASRLLAVSATLWDWDEVQFAMGVDDYDAAAYRPHPPGFPVFIALAKIARLVAPTDFRALQVITVGASMALFPLLFSLFRELRFPFAAAWSGALLTTFLPNVWFYGGTGFSDVPALAVTVAACTWLIRGARDRSALLFGAILLGLAAAFRPQALLAGAAPALYATWMRRRRLRDVGAAIAAGASVIAIAYSGAVLASSSWEEYAQTSARLRDYLRNVDSFLNPERPPLDVLFEFFFLLAIPGGDLSIALVTMAAAGLVITAIRREGRPLLLVLIFVPFQVFAWLMLDYHSVSRYGVMFAPMYALLAAQAVVGLLAWIPGFGRMGGAIVMLLFTAAYARWTFPALTEVRRNPSPPIRAITWLNEHVPASSMVYVHPSFTPYARYLMGGRLLQELENPAGMGGAPPSADAFVVTETPVALSDAVRFVRGRGRLFDIARQRYFETTVLPAGSWAQIAEGWHGVEWHGGVVWLWMGKESKTLLPPAAGPMQLSLELEPAPEKGPPVIEAELNGKLVARFEVTTPMEKTWTVQPRADGWNELVLRSDRFVNPREEGLSEDSRDLSVRLLGYGWSSARR